MIIQIEIPDNDVAFVGLAYGVVREDFKTEKDAITELKRRILEEVRSPIAQYKKDLASASAGKATEVSEKL